MYATLFHGISWLYFYIFYQPLQVSTRSKKQKKSLSNGVLLKCGTTTHIPLKLTSGHLVLCFGKSFRKVNNRTLDGRTRYVATSCISYMNANKFSEFKTGHQFKYQVAKKLTTIFMCNLISMFIKVAPIVPISLFTPKAARQACVSVKKYNLELQIARWLLI